MAPHLHCVSEEGVFGCGLFVLAICQLEETCGERVAVVPVKHAREGKQIILFAWIRGIADEGVDPSFVEREPGGVEVSYDGGSVDEIAKMEMMVVVI